MPANTTLQNPVRFIREAAKLKREEFAEEIGVEVRTVYRCEAESRLPKGKAAIRNIRQIAEQHNIELNLQ